MKSTRSFKHEWVRIAVLILFVGAATAKVPAQIAVYPTDACKEWSAWYDAQAARPKTLHVHGICTFHTSGYEVKLIRRKTRTKNSASCILDMAITAPTGIAGIVRGIRHVPALYSEQIEQQCESVTIEPDHITLPIKIIQ